MKIDLEPAKNVITVFLDNIEAVKNMRRNIFAPKWLQLFQYFSFDDSKCTPTSEMQAFFLLKGENLLENKAFLLAMQSPL